MSAVKSNNRQNAYINKNVLVRVTFTDGSRTLWSANKMDRVLGAELKNKLVNDFLSRGVDKHTRKLRKGVKLCFVSK